MCVYECASASESVCFDEAKRDEGGLRETQTKEKESKRRKKKHRDLWLASIFAVCCLVFAFSEQEFSSMSLQLLITFRVAPGATSVFIIEN